MGKNNIGASQSSTLDGSFGKSEKSKAKKYKIIGLVAIICVLGISINYFNKKYIYTDAIAKNIFIEGIDVSNLTKEEAINYINENITPSDIQLNYDGETNIISLDEIDLKYNTSEVVDEAYNYTKTDSYFENIKRFFDLNKNIKNLEIKSLYNENKLSEKIQSISESINVAMENAKVYISDSGNISASSATIGKELDIAATKESIYDADLLYKLQLSGRMGCQCCNKLYKREIWISHSLRFREGDYYEDIEMAFKVVQAYQQAYIMNSPYYKYRMRQNSIVVSTNKKIIKDFINNTNAVLSMVRCECIDYQCFIEAFKVNAFIYTVKLLSKLRDDDAFVCYDLCKNVYADIKLWNVMSNSKLLFRNKIQYIWYIDIVLACKLLNFR